MIKALIIDDNRGHAEQLERDLHRRGLTTILAASIPEAVRRLRSRAASFDLVVLSMADRKPWFDILQQLQQAAWQAGIGESPLFLCVSRMNFGAEFQLQVERMGVRFVFE